MALRSLPRKLPALGLRSPAGSPVHAPSPAAAYRHMSSHARTGYVDPSPRINMLVETLDQQIAQNKKDHRITGAREHKISTHSDLATWDMLSKAVCYPINAYVAFHVLRHLF